MPKAPKQRVVTPVNVNSSTFVDIACTIPCRQMEVVETDDGSGTFAFQGLQYKLADDNYTQVYTAAPGEVIARGNAIAEGNARGSVVGKNAQTDIYGRTIPADVPLKVRSLSLVATQVLVKETS